MKIKHYETEEELIHCFEVMKALRPKLNDANEFVARVKRQQEKTYRILGVEVDGKVLALAGYREAENLIHGKFIYIDDLISLPNERSRGYGKILIDEVCKIAKNLEKTKVVLDTGPANTQAQKFYYREGFLGLGIHFLRDL